jgi:hypothetical protein
MTQERDSQIHRFRDFVALHIAGSPTEYLTPKEARKIAKAMNAAARDIERVAFTSSDYKTQRVALLPAEGSNRPDYNHKRKGAAIVKEVYTLKAGYMGATLKDGRKVSLNPKALNYSIPFIGQELAAGQYEERPTRPEK